MNENELPDIQEEPNLAVSDLLDSTNSINDSSINSKINENNNNNKEKENEINITISIDHSNKTLNFQNYINSESEYIKDSLLIPAIENPISSTNNIIGERNSKDIIKTKPLKFARSYSTANNNIKFIFNSPSIPFKADSELKTSQPIKLNTIHKITSKNIGKLNISTISTQKMTYEVSPVMNFNIHRKISITNTLYNMSLSKLNNLNNSILDSALLLSKNNNDETSMSLLNLNSKFQKKNSLLNIVKATNLTSKNTYTRKPTLVNHDSMFQSAENIALFEKHKIKKTLQIVSKDSSLNHNNDNKSIDLNGNMNKKKDSLINIANDIRNIDNQKEEKIDNDYIKQNDSKVREELSNIINKDKNRSEMSRRSSLVKKNSTYIKNITTNKTKNHQKRLSIVNNNNKNAMEKLQDENIKDSFLMRTKDSYFTKNAISLNSHKLDSKMTLDSLDEEEEIDSNDNDNDKILTIKEREEKILRILYSKKSLLNKLKLINRNDFLSYLIKQFDDIKKAKRIIFNKYNESNDYEKKQIQLLISDVRCKYNLTFKEHKLLDYSSEALIKYYKLIQLDKIVIDPSKTIVKNKNLNKSNKNRNKMNVSNSKKILSNIINNSKSKSKSKSKDKSKSTKKRVVKMNLENTSCISKKKTDKIDIKTFNTDSSHSYLEDCDENYPCSKQYRYFNTELLNELFISYSSHNYVIPNYSSHSLAIQKILIKNSVSKQESILRIQSEYFQSNKQEPVFMLNLKKFTNLKRKKKGYFKNPNEYERLHDTNSFSTNNSIVDSDLSFAKRDPIFEALVISKYKLLVNNEPKTTINKYNKRGHNSVIFSKSKYKNNFDIFGLNIYSENEYKDLFEAKNIVKIEKKRLGKMSIRQRIEIFGHNKEEEENNIKSIKNDFERTNNKSSFNIPYIDLKRFSIDPKKLKREKYLGDEHMDNNRKSNFGKTCDSLMKVNIDTSMRKSAKSVFAISQNENIKKTNMKKLSSISNFSNVIEKTKKATFNVNNNKILINDKKNADNLNTFTDNIFKKKSSNINDNDRNESKLNKSFNSNTDIRPEVFSKKNFFNFYMKNKKFENPHLSNIKKEKISKEKNNNNINKQVKISVENNEDINKTKKSRHKNTKDSNEYLINKEEKIFSFKDANIIQFDSKEEINKITQLCEVIKTAYNKNLDIRIKKEEEKKMKQKENETKKTAYDFNFDEKSSEDDSSNDIIISNKEKSKDDNFERICNNSTSNFKNNISTSNTKKNTFNKSNVNNNPIFKKLTAKQKDNFKLKENSINNYKEPQLLRKINPYQIGKNDKENISEREIANNKPKTQSKFFLGSSNKKDNNGMGCNDKDNYGIKNPNIGLSNKNINIRKQSSSNMGMTGFNSTSSPFLLFKKLNKLNNNHKTSTNNSSEDSGSFIHLNHNDSYSLLKIKYQQLQKSYHQARCIKLLETPMPYLPLPDILKPKNRFEKDKNKSFKKLNSSTSQGILDLLYNNKKNKLGNIAKKYLQSNFADKKKYAKIKKNRSEMYINNYNRKGSNSSRISISHLNSFNKESNDNFVNSNTNRSEFNHKIIKISTNNKISRVSSLSSPNTITNNKNENIKFLNSKNNSVSEYNKDVLNVNGLTKNTDIIVRKSTYMRIHSQINDTIKPFFNKISSNKSNSLLVGRCQSTIKKRVNDLQIKKIPYYNE